MTETTLPDEVRKAHENFQAIIGSVPREHRAVLETLTNGILDLVRQKLELAARVQELERENGECRRNERDAIRRIAEQRERAETSERRLERSVQDIAEWRPRALTAEAELAAIKKRIDGSPEGDVVADIPGGVLIDVEGVSSRSLGKRVALLPLDDEAKS